MENMEKTIKKPKEQQRNELWDFTLHSDLILHVEERDLYVHREILCSHSPVFKVMLEGNFLEKRMDRIPLPGKSIEQVLQMLNFIYPFGHEITDSTDIFNLLNLSREYQIEKLKEQCESYLKKKPATLELLLTAQEYDLLSLRERCLKFVSSRALSCVQDNPKFEFLKEDNKIRVLQDQLQNLQQYCKKVWRISSAADPRYIPMILPTCNHRPKGCSNPHYFCSGCKATVLRNYIRNESWRMGLDTKLP